MYICIYIYIYIYIFIYAYVPENCSLYVSSKNNKEARSWTRLDGSFSNPVSSFMVDTN